MNREFRKFAITMTDQAVLSGLNMFVGGLFIAAAPKEEYGTYTLAFAFVLLLNSVQNAVITTPLTTNGARLGTVEQENMVDAMFRLQIGLVAALAAATAVGLWLWALAHHGPWSGWLTAGVALAVVGAWLREFRRTEHFLRLDAKKVFAGDLMFVGLASACLVAVYWKAQTMRASWALLIVGLAGVATGASRLSHLLTRKASSTARRNNLSLLADQVRWTLPNVFVTWGQTTSYSYIVALVAGSAAVADISAARLFLTPVSFAVLAWSRLFMPRAGALLSVNDSATVLRLTRRGALELIGLLVLYSSFVAFFFGLGGARLLPAKYSSVSTLVAIWGAYFVSNLIRGAATTALMAHAAFRVLLVDTLWAALLSLPLMIGLGYLVGATGVVYGMVVGELVLAVLLWRELRIRSTSQPHARGYPDGAASGVQG